MMPWMDRCSQSTLSSTATSEKKQRNDASWPLCFVVNERPSQEETVGGAKLIYFLFIIIIIMVWHSWFIYSAGLIFRSVFRFFLVNSSFRQTADLEKIKAAARRHSSAPDRNSFWGCSVKVWQRSPDPHRSSSTVRALGMCSDTHSSSRLV